MLDSMTFKQFQEWIAFEGLEPFGDRREDIRNGYIVATLLNVWRGKNRKAVSTRDVMLKFGDEPSEKPNVQTPEQQKFIGQTMMRMFNQAEDEQERKRNKRRVRRESTE